MGVWIETLRSFAKANGGRVTPCMGVWIETLCPYGCLGIWLSHTLYGCVD